MPKGSLKLLGYYQGTQSQEINFSVRGAGGCSVATSNGPVTFACDQTGDVTGKMTGGDGVVKLVYQPWEILQYYAALGVGSRRLNLPNGQMTGDNPGLSFSFGGRATIYPDTIVTPGIAVDAGVTRADYRYNRFEQGLAGADTRVNQRLGLWMYQVAVESSHLFPIDKDWKLEPYGGVKWLRIQSDLHDLQTGGHAGGQKDVVTPFVGLRVPVGEHEAFFAEGSQFVNGTQESGGLEIKF